MASPKVLESPAVRVIGDSVPEVLKSKVVQSLPPSPSVRTTVPEAIRVALGLSPGSTLDWTFDPDSKIVTVAKGSEAPEVSPRKRKRRARSPR